jgi:hypothetical protein
MSDINGASEHAMCVQRKVIINKIKRRRRYSCPAGCMII